ncbi:hypothetical protein [Frigidibacter albus]|uniref:hypothetical protein n=1 Tax=Frigidibacter albus TaxID=1465486 RepID=UPI0013D6BFD7|nr:hypothetical protein [Frigidibacter albus]
MCAFAAGTDDSPPEAAPPLPAPRQTPLEAPVILDRIDAMTRHAIETLLDGPDGWRPLGRDLVARWPEARALELIFAIVSAAEAIETMFAPGSPALASAAAGYKVAALLGVDLFAMQSLGLPHHAAADFIAYWRSDPWFRLV